jgi:hypothetical protein
VLEFGDPALPAPDVTFVFRGSSHIIRDIPRGYSVIGRTERNPGAFDHYNRFTVAPEFTNNGSLSVEIATGIDNQLWLLPEDLSSTQLQRFINRGTLTVVNESSYFQVVFIGIEGHVLNASTGSVAVGGNTIVRGDLVNEGTITIAAGKTL